MPTGVFVIKSGNHIHKPFILIYIADQLIAYFMMKTSVLNDFIVKRKDNDEGLSSLKFHVFYPFLLVCFILYFYIVSILL